MLVVSLVVIFGLAFSNANLSLDHTHVQDGTCDNVCEKAAFCGMPSELALIYLHSETGNQRDRHQHQHPVNRRQWNRPHYYQRGPYGMNNGGFYGNNQYGMNRGHGYYQGNGYYHGSPYESNHQHHGEEGGGRRRLLKKTDDEVSCLGVRDNTEKFNARCNNMWRCGSHSHKLINCASVAAQGLCMLPVDSKKDAKLYRDYCCASCKQASYLACENTKSVGDCAVLLSSTFTPGPTAAPTTAPTKTPTAAPSKSPTKSPEDCMAERIAGLETQAQKDEVERLLVLVEETDDYYGVTECHEDVADPCGLNTEYSRRCRMTQAEYQAEVEYLMDSNFFEDGPAGDQDRYDVIGPLSMSEAALVIHEADVAAAVEQVELDAVTAAEDAKAAQDIIDADNLEQNKIKWAKERADYLASDAFKPILSYDRPVWDWNQQCANARPTGYEGCAKTCLNYGGTDYLCLGLEKQGDVCTNSGFEAYCAHAENKVCGSAATEIKTCKEAAELGWCTDSRHGDWMVKACAASCNICKSCKDYECPSEMVPRKSAQGSQSYSEEECCIEKSKLCSCTWECMFNDNCCEDFDKECCGN